VALSDGVGVDEVLRRLEPQVWRGWRYWGGARPEPLTAASPLWDLRYLGVGYRVLKRAGFHRLGQLCAVSERQLLSLKGFGGVGLLELKEALAWHGFALSATDGPMPSAEERVGLATPLGWFDDVDAASVAQLRRADCVTVGDFLARTTSSLLGTGVVEPRSINDVDGTLGLHYGLHRVTERRVPRVLPRPRPPLNQAALARAAQAWRSSNGHEPDLRALEAAIRAFASSSGGRECIGPDERRYRSLTVAARSAGVEPSTMHRWVTRRLHGWRPAP
jgi:hypothetical protein